MSAPGAAPTRDNTTRWRPVIRACWLALTGMLVVLWLIGQAALFHALQTPCAGASCQFVGFTAEQFRVLRAAGITPAAYAILGTVVFNTAVLVWLGVGLLIFVRRGTSLGMLVISFAIATSPLTVSAPPLGVLVLGPIIMPLVGIFQFAGDVLFFAIFYIFPDGRFVPRWTRWVFLAGVVVAFVTVALPANSSLNDPSGGIGLLPGAATGGVYVVAFGAQVYRYRRVSTPRQRQQSKWAVLGLLAAGISQAMVVNSAQFLTLVHASAHDQAIAFIVANTITPLIQLVIPLSIGIAILRSGLWDIDLLINRALVYGSLTAALAAVYFGVVVGLQSLLTVITRQTQPQPVVIVATTLLIAALFTPLRRRLQAVIDRRFYRRKYDAARTWRRLGRRCAPRRICPRCAPTWKPR